MTKFGLILPTGFRGEFGKHQDNLKEEIENISKLCEETNFDSLWSFDHLSSLNENYPIFESWSILAYLASITKKIRIGTLVTCNSFRDTGILAQLISTVDHLSKGRVNFGIGACWFEPEFKQFGVPFEKAAMRIKELDETLNVLTRLWKENKITHKGNFDNMKDAYIVKPYQKPHPPIYVAGRGNKMLNIAAKYGNGWNMTGPLEEYTERIKYLESCVEKQRRSFKDIEKTVLLFFTLGKDKSEIEIKRNSITSVERQYPNVDISWRTQADIAIRNPKKTLNFVKRKLLNNIGPAKFECDPESCAEIISKYRDAGADHIIIHFRASPVSESIELFADKVLPLVNR